MNEWINLLQCQKIAAYCKQYANCGNLYILVTNIKCQPFKTYRAKLITAQEKDEANKKSKAPWAAHGWIVQSQVYFC